MSGCELHTSDNGKLDGMWHLTAVDTIRGRSCDLSKERRFWAFQMNILETRNANNGDRLIWRFNRHADSLTVSQPKINNRDLSDPAVSDPALTAPYGISGTEGRFRIAVLNDSKMLLEGKTLRLSFKRF